MKTTQHPMILVCSEEERTEDGTDDSSINSEIPQINGVSIGDLNIDNELRRGSLTNYYLDGIVTSASVKSSLTQTSLVRSVRWTESPFGEKADSPKYSPAG